MLCSMPYALESQIENPVMEVTRIGEDFGFAIEHKGNEYQRSGSSHNDIRRLT